MLHMRMKSGAHKQESWLAIEPQQCALLLFYNNVVNIKYIIIIIRGSELVVVVYITHIIIKEITTLQRIYTSSCKLQKYW